MSSMNLLLMCCIVYFFVCLSDILSLYNCCFCLSNCHIVYLSVYLICQLLRSLEYLFLFTVLNASPKIISFFSLRAAASPCI